MVRAPLLLAAAALLRSADASAVVARLGALDSGGSSDAGAALPRAARAGAAWANASNLTVYRVTPLSMEGVANMDTADAAGDIAFGLLQLLLPFICADAAMAENMIWCANRKWLTNSSDATRQMVYRKFHVLGRRPFGAYARCNPDPKTGVFACCTSDNPGAPGCNTQHQRRPRHGRPNYCHGPGQQYEPHGTLVLAGDVLATIEQPQPGPGVGDPTSNCCHVCNQAADCDGMQFLHNSSGSYCVLIANGSLVPNVNRTASTSNSRSGLGLQPNRRCWNRDPPPNLRQSGGWTDLSESFKPFCSEHECGCEAAETLALGWQPQAMCNSMPGHKKGGGPKIVAGDLGRRLATTVLDDEDTGEGLVGSGFGPWPPYPGYWQCKSAVAQTCGGWDSWKNKGNCFGCARGNMNPGRRDSSCLSGAQPPLNTLLHLQATSRCSSRAQCR